MPGARKAPAGETEGSSGSTASTSTSLMDRMDTETELTIPLRGRGHDADVLAIRDELVKMKDENTARSFKDVEKEDQEPYARKVRAAGKLADIEVATRYDADKKKLIWGPKSVLKELSGKKSE